MLAELSSQTTSEGRRELLRKVTEALDPAGTASSQADMAQFDEILATVAEDYSVQVRSQIARLVASGAAPFSHTAQRFAMDDIEVARPILEKSASLSEATLLQVIGQKSQDHMLAVTKRHAISPVISHALVEKGDDMVVSSLLRNGNAEIAPKTYDAVARRAETSVALQAPLVERHGVPLEHLNMLYTKVEARLRKEIVAKFDSVSAEELEKAFARSRERVSRVYKQMPDDFDDSSLRIDLLERHGGGLKPPALISLLREGNGARTAFKIAFARLTEVDFDLIERVVENFDLDTAALLCRGSNFDRALFVSLAIGLDRPDRAMAGAEEFGKLYESVPVQAAQRALRFWKVRHAA